MDVLTKKAPLLDVEDVSGSLRQIQDYLISTMEQIDYTLGRHGIQLGKVNPAETEAQLKQLKGQVNALSSAVAAFREMVNTHAAKLEEVESGAAELSGRMNAAEDAVSGLAARMDTAEQGLSALEARVSALEQAEGGGA